MKIPYGLSNFKDVITGGYTYIDKTAYITHLEDSGKYQILLRPRRFGTVGEVTALQPRKFELDKSFARDDFIGLLAYMGLVSLQGETLTGEVFAIPNHVIRELCEQVMTSKLN